MSAFMAQMSQQCPVGFIEILPLPLTLDGIGFRDVDGDDAVGVSRELAFGKIKFEAGISQLLAAERQAEPEQGVDQNFLGAFEQLPGMQALRAGQVRNGLVELTCDAEAAAMTRRRQPVDEWARWTRRPRSDPRDGARASRNPR